jgi:hypothetical protein
MDIEKKKAFSGLFIRKTLRKDSIIMIKEKMDMKEEVEVEKEVEEEVKDIKAISESLMTVIDNLEEIETIEIMMAKKRKLNMLIKKQEKNPKIKKCMSVE